MPSPKPAVIVRREFEATPEVVTQQLRACIVGPACELVRFNKASEKSKGFVETVSSLITDTVTGGVATQNLYSADVLKAFPTLSASSGLDVDSVKVFMENAFLTYADFNDDGDFRPTGVTSGTTNTVNLSASTWKGSAKDSGGVARSRNTNLVQDVAVGDIVQLYTGAAATATLIKTTKVSGFVADSVAGAFGTPVFTKTASGAASTLAANYAGNTGLEFAVSAASAFNSDAKALHDPRRFGKRENTYTITVTSHDGTNVGISVTTDTGADQGSYIIPVAGTSSATLPSGLTITSNKPAGSAVVIGGSATFAYGPVHTAYSVGAAGALNLTVSGTVSSSLTKDTVYYLTCTSGGSVKSASGASFRVSTNNGADVVSNVTVAGFSGTSTGATVTLGSFGLSLAFGQMSADTYAAGFVKGDQLVVAVTAATSGAIMNMIVADPYSATAAVTRVRISKQKTVEIPPFRFDASTPNWSLSNPLDKDLRRVSVRAKVMVRDSSVNSGNTDLAVTAGDLYFQFRGFRDIPRAVGAVNTLSDITSQLGVIDPENPLAFGVYKAFSNANGATVHFIPTVSDTLDGDRGFADALALAKGNRNCYSLVPLSTSKAVWDAFVAHAADESAPEAGRYRIVWIAPEVEKHFKIQDSPVGDASTILVASTVSKEAGKYTLTVGSGLDSRFTENVRAGDWVRSNFGTDSFGKATYSEYRISAVVDNTTLVIASLVDPNLVSSKIEIFRDLTPAEAAAEYVKISGGYSSERVFALVPNRGVNGLRVDGTPVKNWFVAAAFAGLRSGSRPHQPLSNVELAGFDGSNATVPAFNESDLDTLRDGGIWVVMNSNDGKIYAERQLSTSTLDNYRKEQSVTCNIDSMSFSVADGLKNLVGRVNITDQNLDIVRADLISILNQFQNATGSLTIGAQLRSYTIDTIFVPTTANDTVKAKITLVVPLPMNTIDITLVI